MYYINYMKKIYLLVFTISLFVNINISYPQDTVKVMAYNLLNFDYTDTSRCQYYRTVFLNTKPDIIVTEEIASQNAVNVIKGVLNSIGSGNYDAGTFINGFDSDNGIFFRSSKFQFLSNTPIHTELRDINEFKVVYIPTLDTIRLYAVHLKASNTTADQQQRGREVDSLRKVTNALHPGSNFMVMGDFNIYASTEIAYTKLLQVIPGNEGQFNDMYNMPGTWNTSAYSIYHTQSPRVRAFGGGATGGMDDRFDLILYSKAINDPGGVQVIPNSLTAYGNDGNHYNDSINRPPNTAVSQQIANALHYAADHLPVYILLKITPPISVQNNTEIVNDYNLYQNYPNPFNPSTRIKFDIGNTGGLRTTPVKLAVYDLLGEEVAVLVNKNLQAGKYDVQWDGANYSSGIYFYKLIAGGNVVTRKMILTK